MSGLAARRSARPTDDVSIDARRAYRDHVIKPAEVRSFRFTRPNGSSAYWFGLTWTPGHLTLVGDVGKMTLTHYSALADFEGGIRWAAGGDYHYLMGKSDKREKELDREGTAEDILRFANQNAIFTLEEVIKERRRYRREVVRSQYQFEAALAEWDFWRKNRSLVLPQGRKKEAQARVDFFTEGEENRPRLEDYLPEHYRVEEAETQVFKPKPREQWRRNYPGSALSGYEEDSKWHIPDGWELWFRIWNALRHYLAYDDEDPNIVRTNHGRYRLAEALHAHLADDKMEGNAVANFCRGDLDIDDYYGDYRYGHRTIWMIEAIHHGANMILDQLDPTRTWGKSWGDPVV